MNTLPFSKLTLLLAISAFLAMSVPALAKRSPPKPVKPVTVNGTTYQPSYERLEKDKHPSGLKAFLVAVDEKTNKELWKVQLYEVIFDLNLETDIQEVYATSLTLTDEGLVVVNEKSKRFLVDLKQHTVSEQK